MNFRRYLLSAIALFIFVSIYEMIVHEYIIFGLYEKSMDVWRDFSVIEERWPLAVAFQLAISAWTAFIFTRLFKEGGIQNGLNFGLYIGVFAGILTATWYLWLDVPAVLGLSWFIFDILEGIGGGLILGSIYRR